MTCARCGYVIHPGQLYILSPGPWHVACPTDRQIAQAKLWRRW